MTFACDGVCFPSGIKDIRTPRAHRALTSHAAAARPSFPAGDPADLASLEERLQRRRARVDVRDLRGRVRRRVFLRRGDAAAATPPRAASPPPPSPGGHLRQAPLHVPQDASEGEDATFPPRPASRARRARARGRPRRHRRARAPRRRRRPAARRRRARRRLTPRLCICALRRPPGWRPRSPRARGRHRRAAPRRARAARQATRAVPARAPPPWRASADVRGWGRARRERGARERDPRLRALSRGRRGPKPRGRAEPAGFVGVGVLTAVRAGRRAGTRVRAPEGGSLAPRARALRGHRGWRGGWRRLGRSVRVHRSRRRLSRPSHCASRSLALRAQLALDIAAARDVLARVVQLALLLRQPRRLACLGAGERRLRAAAARAPRHPPRASPPPRPGSAPASTSARRRSACAYAGGEGVDGHQPRGVAVAVRLRERLREARHPGLSAAFSAPSAAFAIVGRASPSRLAVAPRPPPPLAFGFRA